MHDRDEHIERYQRQREAFLALLLAVLVGGGFVLFLIFVSGGFFVWVLVVSLGLGLLGCLHYLLWGRSLSQAVQAEREELEWEREAEERNAPGAPWERRF